MNQLEQVLARDAAGRIDFDQLLNAPRRAEFYKGKSALVTGGASGLGAACVRFLVSGGARVVIADLNDKLGAELEALDPSRVKFIQCDVCNYDSQLLLFADALAFFPSKELDMLIVSAGVQGQDWTFQAENDGAAVLLRYAEWARSPPHNDEPHMPSIKAPSTKCLDTGLQGTLYSVQIATRFAMGMDKPRTVGSLDKSIVLVCSTAGFRALPYRPDYTAAKFGVRGLFRVLRDMLPLASPQGPRINMVAPFFLPTPMTGPLIPGLEKKGIRLGSMQDFVRAVTVLLECRSINGRAVAVTAEGLRDLCDDVAGQDASLALLELVKHGWLSVPQSATLSEISGDLSR